MSWWVYKSEVPVPCPRCKAAGVVRSLVSGRYIRCPRCGGGKRVLIEIVSPVEASQAA